jgi:hypothetical protein
MGRCSFVLMLILAGLALSVPAVAAADTTVLGDIPCAAQPDGTRLCQGATTPTFDGTPLDVGVALPPVPASGPDGGYPLIIVAHGFANERKDLDKPEQPFFPSAHELARRGYAVLAPTDRGFGGSCGTPQARAAAPSGCAKGWIHLMDVRYEVADAQFLAGELADASWIDPQQIGAIGESYGGGETLLLATLKDRVVTPSGTLEPWRSPVKGLPMRIAAATPVVPWSDLVYSLLPNGRTLDYTITPPSADVTPVGVAKQSVVAGLYALGQAPPGFSGPVYSPGGYYAPPGADPSADLTRWVALLNAGEPYDGEPLVAPSIAALTDYRSPYYLLDRSAAPMLGSAPEAPAPMLISNGFTDDIFPVDEALRYYNLERSLFPTNPIALTFMDYGHPRAQNKAADIDLLRGQINAWIDHYVKGTAPDPGQPVVALTQTCPVSAPSGGPFVADSWVDLHPGELSYSSAAPQTILSGGGDPAVAKAFDPVAGSGACATASAGVEPGIATYELPTASGAGYTLLGAPLVIARLTISGAFPEIASRLLDVGPDGTETLVARGVWRPGADVSGTQYFQLHAGAWHFAPGHHPRLELLGRDAPFLRASNGQFTVTVSSLKLLLPTRETTGNGIVANTGLPIPPGARAAPGVRVAGAPRLLLRFYGRRRSPHGVLVVLRATRGSFRGLTLELIGGRSTVAKAFAARVGIARRRVVLRTPSGRVPRNGRYTLRVRRGRVTLVVRHVHLG